MFFPSNHAVSRTAQRNLPIEAIDYILEHAQVIHRAGVLFYYLRDCDIPDQDRPYKVLTRLVGTALVVSKDRQTIITMWRNRTSGLKHIKRKPRYSSSQTPFFA